MRKLLGSLLLIQGFVLAQDAGISGRWVVNADFYGTPINLSLELSQKGDKLTGDLGGDKLEGTVSGGVVRFVAKDERGGTSKFDATVWPLITMVKRRFPAALK